MKNNIGIIKASLFNKLSDNYITTGNLEESKNLSMDFLNVVKKSPILQLQLETYSNLEKKCISEDIIATRYIDTNITQFQKYSREQVLAENELIKDFLIEDDQVDDDKKSLYEAIDILILQSAKSDEIDIAVDSVHESFVTVLNHLKSNKPLKLSENKIDTKILKHFDVDQVINIAVKKFNEKFSHLDENEKSILKVITMGTLDDKKAIFESLRNENLDLLGDIDNNGIQDKISETIEKINKMDFEEDSTIKDVTSLIKLKESLS